MSWQQWKPYVPVATRRAHSRKKMELLRRKGVDIQPVEIEGIKIARTFWGEAWCDHLESFSDFENRLPRGRTYVRNGSVCHLDISRGKVSALVSGSELYTVKVTIKTLARKNWSEVKKRCAGQIGSLLELLQGRLSEKVMTVVTDPDEGLFPPLREIELECSCPDWAVMCKHVAAALYGVGARLDEKPELLFLLRGVDHEELINTEVGVAAGENTGGPRRIADEALAEVFGIEMSEESPSVQARPTRRGKRAASKSRKVSQSVVKRTPKRPPKTGTRKTPVKKTTGSRKGGAKRAARSTPSTRPITGQSVTRLRTVLGMSQSQFASLLGVSTATIGNWEKKKGMLTLRSSSLDAWNAARRLTKRQAWGQIEHT